MISLLRSAVNSRKYATKKNSNFYMVLSPLKFNFVRKCNNAKKPSNITVFFPLTFKRARTYIGTKGRGSGSRQALIFYYFNRTSPDSLSSFLSITKHLHQDTDGPHKLSDILPFYIK